MRPPPQHVAAKQIGVALPECAWTIVPLAVVQIALKRYVVTVGRKPVRAKPALPHHPRVGAAQAVARHGGVIALERFHIDASKHVLDRLPAVPEPAKHTFLGA